MTEKEKMIPLSVVDAKIKEIEEDNVYQGPSWDGVRNHFINKIEEIKKEAIVPNPSELEQRIRDRIKELEKHLMKPIKYPDYKYARIDELRKLLSND